MLKMKLFLFYLAFLITLEVNSADNGRNIAYNSGGRLYSGNQIVESLNPSCPNCQNLHLLPSTTLTSPTSPQFSGNYQVTMRSMPVSLLAQQGQQQPQQPTLVRYYTKEEFERLYQNALSTAWEEYGPKTKQRTGTTDPQPQQQTQYPQSSQYAHRDTANVYPNNNYNQGNSFQAWDSEWDAHVTPQPMSAQVQKPTIFNRMLASYIDFEVNNHEVADFLRRAVAFALVGVLIALWVGMGIYFGLFPLKWLYFLGLGHKRDLDTIKSAEGRIDDSLESNHLMSELTERIFLALDGDWLRKLEERVKQNGNQNWLKTHVQCCILPDAKTKGMADCQLLVKRGKKVSTFKCLTDLIYNFQFGPVDKNKSETF